MGPRRENSADWSSIAGLYVFALPVRQGWLRAHRSHFLRSPPEAGRPERYRRRPGRHGPRTGGIVHVGRWKRRRFPAISARPVRGHQQAVRDVRECGRLSESRPLAISLRARRSRATVGGGRGALHRQDRATRPFDVGARKLSGRRRGLSRAWSELVRSGGFRRVLRQGSPHRLPLAQRYRLFGSAVSSRAQQLQREWPGAGRTTSRSRPLWNL